MTCPQLAWGAAGQARVHDWFVEGGHQLDFGRLLQTNIVLEMQDVGDDGDKAFGMGIVLVRLAEQLRMAERGKALSRRSTSCFTTVIEQAHLLFGLRK